MLAVVPNVLEIERDQVKAIEQLELLYVVAHVGEDKSVLRSTVVLDIQFDQSFSQIVFELQMNLGEERDQRGVGQDVVDHFVALGDQRANGSHTLGRHWRDHFVLGERVDKVLVHGQHKFVVQLQFVVRKVLQRHPESETC